MVLFSSISTFVTPVGQIDYVAANAFLNAFAESCGDRRPYPVVAIDWGIWKGIGMVAASAASQSDTIGRGWKSRAAGEGRGIPIVPDSSRLGDGTSQVHWLPGQISTQRDWLADEHRLLRGDALVPATGYVELLRAALTEMGGDGQWSLVQLSFLRPFYVDDKSPSGFRIRLRGNASHWRVKCSRSWRRSGKPANWWRRRGSCPCQGRGCGRSCGHTAALRTAQRNGDGARQHSHATGSASALRSAVACAAFPCSSGMARHWPSSGLRQRLPRTWIRSSCILDLLDIATGCAMDLIPGYREQETPQNLWVPLGYASFTMRGPMPAKFHSWVRLPETAAWLQDLPHSMSPWSMRWGCVCGSAGAAAAAHRWRVAADAVPAAVQSSDGDEARQRAIGPAEKAMAHNVERGISEPEGIDTLQRILASVDRPVVIASSFRPADLLRQADVVRQDGPQDGSARFARPELETTYEARATRLKDQLAELWGKLLGVEKIGVRDSFFDLGGHSLVAVRLFNEIRTSMEWSCPCPC